ncbi:MAG: hypothetical protein A2177_08360 [Spirochaetes bacterium RBG_13_68_11]|nr:MAG: hypothetical protein A2177_08360 [Spirochaetes bacterium RBG_13_68_11]
MKVFSKEFLAGNLYVHPYDSNPDYFSYVSFFNYSPDGKTASGYWEAPKGWLEFTFSGFEELNYVIEGEVEITNLETGEKIVAKPGDVYLIKDGDHVRWTMTKFTRTVFWVYPLTQQIRDMISSWKKKEPARQ